MHRAKAENQSVWFRTKVVPKTVSKETFLGVSEKKQITWLGCGM